MVMNKENEIAEAIEALFGANTPQHDMAHAVAEAERARLRQIEYHRQWDISMKRASMRIVKSKT